MSKLEDICSIAHIRHNTPEGLLGEYHLLHIKSDQAAFINAVNSSGQFVAIFDFLELAPFFKSKSKKIYKLKTLHNEITYFVEYTGKLREDIEPYNAYPYKANNGEDYKTAVLLEFEANT